MANIELDLEFKCIEAAAQFMERQGYSVIDKYYECPAGNIDIVAADEEMLVFVEVHARTYMQDGFDDTEVSRQKAEMLSLFYLAEHDLVDMRYRFDAISMIVLGENKASLRHHINVLGMGGAR